MTTEKIEKQKDIFSSFCANLARSDYSGDGGKFSYLPDGSRIESGFDTIQFKECVRMVAVMRRMISEGSLDVSRFVNEVVASYLSILTTQAIDPDSEVLPGHVVDNKMSFRYRDHAHPTHRHYAMARAYRTYPELIAQYGLLLQCRAFSSLSESGASMFVTSDDLDLAGSDIVVCTKELYADGKLKDLHLMSVSVYTNTPNAVGHYGDKVSNRPSAGRTFQVGGLSVFEIHRAKNNMGTRIGGVSLNEPDAVDQISEAALVSMSEGKSTLVKMAGSGKLGSDSRRFLENVQKAMSEEAGKPVMLLELASTLAKRNDSKVEEQVIV